MASGTKEKTNAAEALIKVGKDLLGVRDFQGRQGLSAHERVVECRVEGRDIL